MLEVGRLYYSYGDGRQTRILAESPTTFFAEGAVAHLTFQLNDAGEVEAMVLHTGGGGEIRAAKVR